MNSLFSWPLPEDYDPTAAEECPTLQIQDVVAARDRRRISLRAAELPALPIPLQSEAIASWVSRAAQSQGVPVAQLLAYLGWNVDGDLDLGISELFGDAGFSSDAFFCPLEHGRHLMAAVAAFSDGPHKLLLTADGPARYRFCPACLREDITPYFRQEWRLDGWRVCWRHRCFMEERCPSVLIDS